MEYSPKLKGAMEEIKQILIKHDIAGTVALHTVRSTDNDYVEGFSEYLFHLTPSYSCCKKGANDELRFQAKAEDFGGDTEKRDVIIHTTANMLTHLTKLSKMIYQNVERFSYTIDNVCKIVHGEDRGITPDIGNRN